MASNGSVDAAGNYGYWGNMILYYNDQPHADGIIQMGSIESGMELMRDIDADGEVTIERIAQT